MPLSCMMETNNYESIGIIHGFDVETAPAFQPYSETGQLIEYLDPGHLKIVLENFFPFKFNLIKKFTANNSSNNISFIFLWHPKNFPFSKKKIHLIIFHTYFCGTQRIFLK